MPAGVQRRVPLETTEFGGVNTALQFSQIPRNQSPKLLNAYMPKIKAIGKRPGSIPVTTAALANPIKHLTVYRSSPTVEDVLAAAGTTLYKFDGTNTLVAQTMTNALVSSDIYTVSFTDANNNIRKIITDGGNLKEYNGTVVKDVVPAADDASPNPPNDLTNVNAKGLKYCWVYSGHIFVSDGKDISWYLKRFYYDYLPSVQYERWVRENDFITGPGIGFNNVCLIPMRRGWGILTGQTVDNFDGNQFINTINGVISGRTIQKLTYPNGTQTIAYLSDDGVHEVFDTGAIDASVRYSTRSLMKDKVDFDAIGLTEAEKQAAVAYYDPVYNMYILCFKQGTNNLAYCFDTRNGEWYPWDNIKANSLVRKGDVLYFAGDQGHLKKFDRNLCSDWDDVGKTTGTPVNLLRFSPLSALEFSGFESYWDYYLLESKQWKVPATLDINVVFYNVTVQKPTAVKNEVFVWGSSKWGDAKWGNPDFTDIVNQPNELAFHKKSKYVQVIWQNNRDEPVEIYKERWKGRTSGR